MSSCHENSSDWTESSVNASAFHLLAQQCLLVNGGESKSDTSIQCDINIVKSKKCSVAGTVM